MIQLSSWELDEYETFDTKGIGCNSDIYIRNGSLLKIINKQVLYSHSDMEENIKYLCTLKHNNISFPDEIVYLDGEFRGYITNKRFRGEPLIKVIENIINGYDDLSFDNVISIKNQLIKMVQFFTDNNVLIDDLNISNILLDFLTAQVVDLDFYKVCNLHNLKVKNMEIFNEYFKDVFTMILSRNMKLYEDVYIYNILFTNKKNNLSYENYVDDVVSLLSNHSIKTLGGILEYK